MLSPGYDKKTIAALVKAFNKQYPFIVVSWTYVSGITAQQRQLFEMAAGKAALDIFSPSSDNLEEYLKQKMFKKYSFRTIAEDTEGNFSGAAALGILLILFTAILTLISRRFIQRGPGSG